MGLLCIDTDSIDTDSWDGTSRRTGAAFARCTHERLAVIRMGDRDQATRALLQRAAAQVRDAVLGHDRVDIAAGGRDGAAVERGDDARMPAIRRRGRHGDDRAPPGGRHAAAHEIHLATDRAEIAITGDLRVHLARQLDLDRRVDGMEARERGGDRDVVRIVRVAQVDCSALLGEVAQPPCPEQSAGDAAPRIAAFVGVGDDAALDQVDQHVGDDAGMHAELAMVVERTGDRRRQRADAELHGRAIGDQRSNPLRHRAFDCGRLGIRHVDDAVVTLDQHVDVRALQAGIAAHGRERGVDQRDHQARRADHRLREVGDDAEREAARRKGLDLNERDIDAQLAATDERRHRADMARHDLRQRRDVPVVGGAVEGAEREMRGVLGAQRGRRRQAEEQYGRVELRALRHQRLRQRQRLARSLRPADDLARTQVVGETQLGKCNGLLHLSRSEVARL